MSRSAGLSTCQVESGVYEVRWGQHVLGVVRRNECADGWWSTGCWSIDGMPAPLVDGGVSGSTRKRHGIRSLRDAARHVAVMASGRIIQFICEAPSHRAPTGAGPEGGAGVTPAELGAHHREGRNP